VATELYTVLDRGDNEAGTTASAIALGSGWTSPLAGHGWEGSDTQIVIRTGLNQLFALMAGKTLSPYREFVVHGDAMTVPVP
jgi:hypothetical protein